MEVEDDMDLEELMPSTLNEDKAAQKQIRKAKAAQNQIIKMMYGGGDDENPLPESVALMENIITHFIQSFCIEAQNLADKNDRNIRVEDFLFLIRKDIHKYKRVSELLGFNDFLKTLRKDDYETIQNVHFVDNKRKKK